MPTFNTPRRFWSKVDVDEPDECWEWLATGDSSGYGLFWVPRRGHRGAHRVAWFLTYGPIPQGLCVLHKCDNRSCCNPYHLFLGTRKDNMVDASRKGRLSYAKLTKKEVLEIRRRYASGLVTQYELADAYGISQGQVSQIISGKRWAWLNNEEEEVSCW